MELRRLLWPLLGLAVLVALAAGGAPALAQTPTGTVGVYYVGREDAVAQAIDRADPYLVRVDEPDLAQVIVLNDAPLSEAADILSGDIQQERLGLVLFCGPFFPHSIEDLRNLLGISTFGMGQAAGPAAVQRPTDEDPLAQGITWQSAPEIQARTLITNPNLLQSVIMTVPGQPLIQRVRGREQTEITIFGGWLSHPSNSDWTAWAYFDYMVYRLIIDAAGLARPLSFADYPQSPTPHATGRLIIAAIGAGLIIGTGALYYLARRRLYLNPKLADTWRRLTALSDQSMVPQGWHEVGFHRPLAGALAFVPVALLFFVPAVVYALHLLPNQIFPSAEGMRNWTRVSSWTMALWILLDAGTGVAAVRHFSARHVHFPHQAARYLQFYVWWQFLSGGLQVGVFCLLIATVMPASGWAHLSYYLLARAALQFPGFLGVFILSFRARQRFDHEQLLLLTQLLGVPMLQAGLVLFLRSSEGASQSLTPALSGVLGLAGGTAVANVVIFGLGAWLHRRSGQRLAALFLPTFDGNTSSEMLGFGVPWALGAAVPVAGLVIQSMLLSSSLITSNAGISVRDWLLIARSAAGFEVLLLGLYRDLLPTFTEALTVNAQTLLRYYVSKGIRYGGWFSFFLFAALGALAEQDLGSVLGPGYESAEWLIPMLAWGALHWTTWLPDRAFEAGGRPGLIFLLSLIEQTLRIGGGLLLSSIWGLWGLLVAFFVALLIRALLARVMMSRHIVRSRIYVWQSLVAPAGAAVLTYYPLRTLAQLWWQSTWHGNSLLLMALLPVALCFYAFLTALLGGWDDGGTAEFRQAVRISGIGYPLAWLVLQSVLMGALVSPLHNRFPIALHGLAREEARALTFAQSSTE